jgi:hypothetical protein
VATPLELSWRSAYSYDTHDDGAPLMNEASIARLKEGSHFCRQR